MTKAQLRKARVAARQPRVVDHQGFKGGEMTGQVDPRMTTERPIDKAIRFVARDKRKGTMASIAAQEREERRAVETFEAETELMLRKAEATKMWGCDECGQAKPVEQVDVLEGGATICKECQLDQMEEPQF